MRALLQRVSHASVSVGGNEVGGIQQGILVLLGIERGDSKTRCKKLAEKVLNYRLFPDKEGKMNLNVQDVSGGLLVVSQFTLAADTRKGLRPSFTPAAHPAEAESLYQQFVADCATVIPDVATGQFGAEMKVSLCNDGPVTFLLEVS